MKSIRNACNAPFFFNAVHGTRHIIKIMLRLAPRRVGPFCIYVAYTVYVLQVSVHAHEQCKVRAYVVTVNIFLFFIYVYYIIKIFIRKGVSWVVPE